MKPAFKTERTVDELKLNARGCAFFFEYLSSQNLCSGILRTNKNILVRAYKNYNYYLENQKLMTQIQHN